LPLLGFSRAFSVSRDAFLVALADFLTAALVARAAFFVVVVVDA
jgi:hypothetical protein